MEQARPSTSEDLAGCRKREGEAPAEPRGSAGASPSHRDPGAGNKPAARPWQFGLRHLLAVMAAVCVAGAGYQWLGPGVLLLFGLILIVSVFGLAISRGKWVEVLVVVGAAFVLATMCLLPLIDGRTPARRSQCQNNLRQISLALQNYHDVYKSFPPAYVADANGKPMHSWRVLLLPFLDRRDLYEQYRFDEPWDGPNNSKLAGIMLKIFVCPADYGGGTLQTSYVAVVGPGTAWPGAKAVDLSDIKDGAANTILVVEVHNSGIHWMEPRDLDASQMAMTINAKSGLGISSGHPGCAQAARADGSVFRIDENTPAATVRAMLTIAGREKVEGP